MTDQFKFTLPKDFDVQRFIGELSHHFRIKDEPHCKGRQIHYDTFDWRIFSQQLTLSRQDNILYLRSQDENTIIVSQKIDTQPRFIGELPEGELKKKLLPVVEMRALMHLFETSLRSRNIRILNNNEKTVARLQFEEIELVKENEMYPLVFYCWLKPVRGYKKHFNELSIFLKEKGLNTSSNHSYILEALKALDKKPEDYSSKLTIQLNPRMRADEAMKILFRFLLKVIKANEEGIQKDIDTEFLHDFRVSIRRTRSALSQIKGIFPATITERFKKDFSALFKATNTLRDYDVYLLHESDYKTLLPKDFSDDIKPLFHYLHKERQEALTAVKQTLNAEEYNQILKAWQTFLDKSSEQSSSVPNAAVPIIDLAKNRIYKKYRGVMKKGSQIIQDSADEKLHALRIECKKLRYLMEFFSSLFHAKKMAFLIKQLKKLQDHLGRFQDLCVQEDKLQSFAENLPITNHQSRRTLLAIGALIGAMDIEKQDVRNTFLDTFTTFASSDNTQLFHALFALKKDRF